MKKIQTSFGMFPADIGVGPSRFARFENEGQPVSAQSIDKVSSPAPNVIDRAWVVLADMNTQRLMRDAGDWEEEDQNDPFTEKQPKQRCAGGCPPNDKKSELDGLLTVAEKTKDVKQVAREKAENDLSLRQEFLQGITIHFARYEKKSRDRWENKGRDLVELVEEERRDRYEMLKRDMNGAKVGVIISEPTAYEDFNYLQFFIDKDDTIEMYAIEHRGDIDDLTNVYKALAEESRDASAGEEASFEIPLYFSEELTFEHIAETIENNFASEESKAMSQDYLSRLHRDVTNVSLIEDYQREAEELAKQIEQELLANAESQGLAMAIIGMMAMGEETGNIVHHIGEDVKETAVEVIDYVSTATHQEYREDEPVKHEPDNESHAQLTEVLVDKGKEEILQVLTAESTIDIDKGENLVLVWKQTAQEVLEITEDQAERLVVAIEITAKEMEDKKETLSFISETEVGTGAVIAIIDAMVLLQLPKPEEKILESVSPAPETIIKEDIVMTWLTSFIDRVKDKQPEEVIAEIQKEEEKTLGNIATLWEVFREASVIEQFQLAVVVWFLLKFTSYFEGLEALREKRAIPEALIHPEKTQWILLAIIWTLAMKREGGIVQTTNSQQSATGRLQRTAVIYAYAS